MAREATEKDKTKLLEKMRKDEERYQNLQREKQDYKKFYTSL